MEGLCPCGHEPTGSIVPVSELVRPTTYSLCLVGVFLSGGVGAYPQNK